MISGGDDEVDEKPIGELFGQLIDEGKAYAKAELGLAKATAEAKADESNGRRSCCFPALLFAQSGGDGRCRHHRDGASSPDRALAVEL
jgi:hypothetical protein